MKICKRILLLALALVMLCAAAVAESIPQSSSLQIQNVVQSGDNMDIYLYMNSAKPIEETTLSLHIDNNPFRWDTIQPLSQTDYPTTWVVLVDNSTIGLKDADKELLKGLLNTVILPKDNLVFLTPEDKLETLTLLDQKDLYINWLDGVKYNEESSVSLVGGIETAMNFLTSGNEKIHERKCLIIMSNVIKRSDKNRSFTELEKVIRSSGVTVYTVITNVDAKPTDNESSEYLAFEMLTSYSACGKSMRTVERDTAVVENYLQVFQKNEGCFYRLSANLADQAVSGTTLKATLEDGAFVVSSSYPVNVQGSAVVEKEKAFNIEDYMEYIIIGGGVLLAGLIVLLLIPKKKKVTPIDPSQLDPDDDDVVPPSSSFQGEPTPLTGGDAYPETQADGLRVTLTVLNNPGRTYSATVQDSVIIGRAPNAGICVGNEDGYISNLHVRFTYTSGALYAKNMSQNGTYINGQRIDDSILLNQNDVMRIGRTEYTITWKA